MPYNPMMLNKIDFDVEKMDLIDLRRKVMKQCTRSQGAIGPCRSCTFRCKAGERALDLYDGIDAPQASEPAIPEPVKEQPEETKKEEPKMKETKEKKERKEKSVAAWYTSAVDSGDPVKWCMNNLGLTIQQAKKRIYMYEYNRFGVRRTKQAETSAVKSNPGPVIKTDPGPVIKTDSEDSSLVSAMQTRMKILTEKQQQYKAQIEELTDKYKKVNDQIEAITMCIELLNDKVSI